MQIIICTTGTSIVGAALRNLPSSEDQRRKGIRNLVQEKRQGRSTADFLKAACAETNSLARMKVSKDDKVFLLHTDTDDGRLCAEEIAHLADTEMGISPKLERIAGLQVTDAKVFRQQGIQNLFDTLNRLVREHPQYEVALNGTGGFKSVVPYLTLYGLINQYSVYYIFEQSNALIELPPAPITFDYDRVSAAACALNKLRDEGTMTEDEFFGLIPNLEFHDRPLYETLLEKIDNLVAPSAFAMLLYAKQDENAGEVYVSPRALASYEKSRGPVREQFNFMLTRVADPLWRAAKIHPLNGTDLIAYKPGNTSERILTTMQGRRVYVCEIAQHDFYETIAKKRKIADYDLTTFGPWTLPAEDTPPPATEEALQTSLVAQLQDAQARLDYAEQQCEEAMAARENAEKARHQLTQEVSAAHDALTQAEQQAEALDVKLNAINQEAERTKQDLQRYRSANQELQQALDWQKMPLWKRVLRRRLLGR